MESNGAPKNGHTSVIMIYGLREGQSARLERIVPGEEEPEIFSGTLARVERGAPLVAVGREVQLDRDYRGLGPVLTHRQRIAEVMEILPENDHHILSTVANTHYRLYLEGQ